MDDLLKLETETFNKLYTDYRLRFIRFAQTYILDISMNVFTTDYYSIFYR